MLDRLFPKAIDNTYRGHPLGLWLFVPIVLIKLLMGANSLISTRHVAMSADGIPLDSYGAAGAAQVLSLFALLGLYLMVLPVLSLIALIRYRAMIPLLYLAILSVQLATRAMAMADATQSGPHPIGFYVNLGLLAAMVIGLLLSLAGDRHPKPALTSPAR